MELQDMKVGDVVEIWITGMVDRYQAVVEAPMPEPRLRVVGDTSGIVLKMGDFILLDPKK